MKSYMKKVLAGALVLGMAGSVSAATTVYDKDKPGWVAAVGIYATEAFEDATLNEGVSVVSDAGYVDTTKEVWWDQVTIEADGAYTTTWSFEEAGVMSFGGSWDLAVPGGPGTGIIAVVINGVEIVVGEIGNDYAGEFWGFVSDVPFTSVLLKHGTDSETAWAETYEMDDMVYTMVEKISLDIHPGGCPNPLNLKSKGVTPMAILGTEDFDVATIDITTLKVNGASPVHSALEDVGTPYEGEQSEPAAKYECNEDGAEGFIDLTLNFDTQAILGGVEKGEQYLTITGQLLDGTPITGKDVVWVK